MRIKFFAENNMDQIKPVQHGVYGIRAVPQAGREAENVIGADSGAPGQFWRQPLSGCGRGHTRNIRCHREAEHFL